MANKKIDKVRIVELFLKQSKEDRIYIITQMISSLTEDNTNTKLQSEIESLKKEVDLYKKNSSKIVRDYIKKELDSE